MSVTATWTDKVFRRVTMGEPPSRGDIDGNLQRIQTLWHGYGDIQTVTAAYTMVATDSLVLASASGGAVTVTLPAAQVMAGKAVTVKKTDSSGNAVTVGGTVDGVSNPTLASQYKAMTVRSDGTTWWKISTV